MKREGAENRRHHPWQLFPQWSVVNGIHSKSSLTRLETKDRFSSACEKVENGCFWPNSSDNNEFLKRSKTVYFRRFWYLFRLPQGSKNEYWTSWSIWTGRSNRWILLGVHRGFTCFSGIWSYFWLVFCRCAIIKVRNVKISSMNSTKTTSTANRGGLFLRPLRLRACGLVDNLLIVVFLVQPTRN